MYYAGIGSRRTPEDILFFMEKLAKALDGEGWILRSGGAVGADQAFERGALKNEPEVFTANSKLHPLAVASVDQFHPNANALGDYVRKLMARNAMQIFGSDMATPVKFVVCWTPCAADGILIPTTRTTGGTGQAIRIAANSNIKVYNLANPITFKRISTYVERNT
jgi:hypothetical protein